MLISDFAKTGNHSSTASAFKPRKSLGQNFLISKDVAAAEAEYAKGMNVLELGPGTGILTKELCKTAKRVIEIEKDTKLAGMIAATLKNEKLTLIEADFFSVDFNALGKIDIMVSNIPYGLSSRVIYWLSDRNMPALICIQKEFAEHMTAKPGTRNYSKLSVVSSLSFSAHHVRDVPAGNFYPKPRVDSALVYLVPKRSAIGSDITAMISLIMNHKKKRLRNAIIDSSKELGLTKKEARGVSAEFKDADLRPFQLEPMQILEIAAQLKATSSKLRTSI